MIWYNIDRKSNIFVVGHSDSTRSDHLPESLMYKALDLMFPSEAFINHYRPDWIKNPSTGFSLEIDRFYPHLKLAFEYNGKSHNISPQRKKDRIKREACESREIVFVVVPAIHKIYSYELRHLIEKSRSRLSGGTFNQFQKSRPVFRTTYHKIDTNKIWA